ncbi:hypothetical protein Taro_002905 [Colocasia esculenta]|uniref:Uncharacterized protein n=1 Tax=Colocasia esculenta TaxID=4460 RepID=A0A843TFJ2_COLES|nr:hypothetical protein [Colocasia esculenta]
MNHFCDTWCVSFYLASDRGDVFKEVKCSVCSGRDFECNVKSFVRGRSCCGFSGDFRWISASDGSCGAGTTRGRCSERGHAIDEEVLACFGVFCRFT